MVERCHVGEFSLPVREGFSRLSTCILPGQAVTVIGPQVTVQQRKWRVILNELHILIEVLDLDVDSVQNVQDLGGRNPALSNVGPVDAAAAVRPDHPVLAVQGLARPILLEFQGSEPTLLEGSPHQSIGLDELVEGLVLFVFAQSVHIEVAVGHIVPFLGLPHQILIVLDQLGLARRTAAQEVQQVKMFVAPLFQDLR